MTKQNQIYKCSLCGNIVEVLHTGDGELVCCEKSMNLLKEKTKDEGQEKHLPVMEKLPENVCRGGDGYKIKVGKVAHPMEAKHYIEWIEVKTEDGKIGKKYLKPDDNTEVEFYTKKEINEVQVYCNIHGLW
ncbi:MAG: desulfoferrodoxin, partial [Candidatus Moranbacteria bacterium]|nr:desulfoferrodoxin [Candidatus Moranbacteria bacterium]